MCSSRRVVSKALGRREEPERRVEDVRRMARQAVLQPSFILLEGTEKSTVRRALFATSPQLNPTCPQRAGDGFEQRGRRSGSEDAAHENTPFPSVQSPRFQGGVRTFDGRFGGRQGRELSAASVSRPAESSVRRLDAS